MVGGVTYMAEGFTLHNRLCQHSLSRTFIRSPTNLTQWSWTVNTCFKLKEDIVICVTYGTYCKGQLNYKKSRIQWQRTIIGTIISLRHNFLQNQLLGPGRLVMYIVFSLFTGNSFSSNFKSLHNVMSRFPNLLKYSCSVDHYSPWPFEAYVNIARVWLQDTKSRVSGNKSLFSKCL